MYIKIKTHQYDAQRRSCSCTPVLICKIQIYPNYIYKPVPKLINI